MNDIINEILGNISIIRMGQSPDSTHYNSEGLGLPLIQGNADIKERRSIKRIWTTQITKECSVGDLLMTVRAPVGSIGIATSNSCLGRGVCGIIANNVNPDYLYYLLISYENSWQIFEQGSTFTAVGYQDIFNFPVKIVNSSIQQKIISKILSTCDSVIEKTQSAIAKYKAIKQGMLHDLFTRGIDIQTGKLRPKYEDAPELYKESKLGWIPKEWQEDTFEKLCDYISDGSHFSPTPIDEGKIIVNVKDMGEFGINYATCSQISKRDFSILKSQNCNPRSGDVLLSKDGTIGRVILFNDNREIVLLSSIAILRPSKNIQSEFLYAYLKSEYFDKQILIKSSGSALKRIVLRDIKSLLLIYTKNDIEQKMISDRIIQIESKLQSELGYLQKLQSIKQGLMCDLLSGKKKVNTETLN
jgi:type I restriction enzyme S subunit